MTLRCALALALSSGVLVVACHRTDPDKARQKAEFERVRAAYEKRVAEQKRATAKPATARAARATGAATAGDGGDVPAQVPASTTPAPARGDAPWIADVPVDIAARAQATATSRGVVMNTRDGELVVARLGKLAHGGAPAKTPVEPTPEGAGNFGLGYGPSVLDDVVYWISHGSLVRRQLPAHGAPGPLQVLARDAFDGTRVAVPIPIPGKTPLPIPATVAYVVRPAKDDDPLLAKLWVDGHDAELLTAEGNSTHSVALVHTEDGVLALSVQARMAMTPVHARRVRFPGGHPLLGDDTVVWVGGGIQSLTEMTVLPTETGLVGLIPHERSMSEFGIARLDIGQSPTMDTPTSWMLYPNGIDPAPVAASRLCGEPVFFYAQPETRVPGSPQELVVQALSDPSGNRALRITTGHVFYFVSMAEVPGGALLAWVTDGVTAACTVRCQTHAK
ncbi:MAG TPA: hypothetical protein VH062_34765 [Polyangiaceae bacterium]|jgi:hypothetical protein|nr:hypothetical protein [Polyangiaceae bacterium]